MIEIQEFFQRHIFSDGWSFIYELLCRKTGHPPATMEKILYAGMTVPMWAFMTFMFCWLAWAFLKGCPPGEAPAEREAVWAEAPFARVAVAVISASCCLLAGVVPGWFICHVCAAHVPVAKEVYMEMAGKFFVLSIMLAALTVVALLWFRQKKKEYLNEGGQYHER